MCTIIVYTHNTQIYYFNRHFLEYYNKLKLFFEKHFIHCTFEKCNVKINQVLVSTIFGSIGRKEIRKIICNLIFKLRKNEYDMSNIKVHLGKLSEPLHINKYLYNYNFRMKHVSTITITEANNRYICEYLQTFSITEKFTIKL